MRNDKRKGIVPDPRRIVRVRSGVGNPFETPYGSEAYRDPGQGQPRPKDIIYDPNEDPAEIPEERRQELREMVSLFREIFQKQVLYTKRPAFVEPPFFAKPRILIDEITLPAGGAVLLPIITKQIEARQRCIVSLVGIELNEPALYDAHELRFAFVLNGDIVDIFEDGSIANLPTGVTTRVPGDLNNPFCLLTNGLQFEVQGEKTLEFSGQNVNGTTDAIVTAMVGIYEYWTPDASQFAGGDIQV